jgi:RNA polymerase sigma-70 factor (ECF subfamily)
MDEQGQGFVERLFREHRRRLAKYFRNRIRKSADVPDLVQEVYARLLTVKSPEAVRSPVSYLYSVASHLLKEYRKREQRYVNLSDLDERTVNKLLGELPSLERELEASQIVAVLCSAIARMPIKTGTAMTLKYRHGLTYSEIAEAMDISPSWVKSLLIQGIAICLAEDL